MSKPLNHDLLERALPFLCCDAQCLVESSSCISQIDDDFYPVPGSCSAECAEVIEPMLELIRDILSEVGPILPLKPDWFVDLIDRRWSLTKKGGEA